MLEKIQTVQTTEPTATTTTTTTTTTAIIIISSSSHNLSLKTLVFCCQTDQHLREPDLIILKEESKTCQIVEIAVDLNYKRKTDKRLEK